MDFLNLSETEILKTSLSGLTIKDLILNSFNETKGDIKQLQDDIKELKDGFTPVINQPLGVPYVTIY